MSVSTHTKLRDGNVMPMVGLGTFEAKDPEVLVRAIKAAVKVGYRHFDTAYIYGNEAAVGQAIRESIDESNGALKREDFFICTKLWGTYHSRVAENLDISLSRLQMDYVDLYLMHSPMGYKEDMGGDFPIQDGQMVPSDVHYIDTWKQMVALKETGKVKSIGVSNFSVKQLKELLELNCCATKPVCNQIEIGPTCRNEELVDYCLANNVVPVAYTSLGCPVRVKEGQPMVMEEPLIVNLAKKYNKTPAQIILRWLLQRGCAVIPKSVTPERIESNFQLFDFEITDEEKESFKTLPVCRFITYAFANKHPHFPLEE
jgi:aldehyde reductase